MKIFVFSAITLSLLLTRSAATSTIRGGSLSSSQDDDDAAAAAVPVESPLDPNQGSLIAQQFGKDPYQGQDKMELVLSGQFRLSDVYVTSDHQIYGAFCDFGFDTQDKDPSLAPRYIDLYGESRHCQEHHVTFPLTDVAAACRKRDATSSKSMQPQQSSIDPDAFIFHQPKSGSSLLTNMIAAASPPTTRVISDPGALSEILTCQECNEDLKVKAVQDVVYFLGRNNKNEGLQQQLYVKLASTDTIGISTVTAAFPDTKWIFLYRDAHVVLQKLMNSKVHRRRSCGIKKRRNPGMAMTHYLESRDSSTTKSSVTTLLEQMTDEQVCAADLATQMAAVTQELLAEQDEGDDNNHNDNGRLVDFEELSSLEGIESVLEYLEVSETNWDRVKEQQQKHSNSGRGQAWEGEVELLVSHAVKRATAEFALLS